jgi:hypothetical protein
MKRNHDIITIEATVRHETERAYLLENLKGEKVWVPKSQCEFERGELQIPEWLAEEKGLI